jgi:hypothetical protein
MKLIAFFRPVALGACAFSAVLWACSSGSSSTQNNDSPDGSANGGGNTPTAACPTPTLSILFAPMYSASDGTHTFQVPAVVNGAPDQTTVKWSASDSSMVSFAVDPDTNGALITTQKAGQVTIVATNGGACGTSVLNITQAAPTDYDNGSSRYNDGVSLAGLRDAGGAVDAAAFGTLACTNCHGPTANGPYKDVAHTPEQTGGFSDDDLKNIFRNGQVPDGGYFDTNIVSYQRWQNFHHWDMTDDEAKGIVIYLRGITPAPQDGTSNFGGRGDGGFYGDGGRRHRDGGSREAGGGPGTDSGGADDAATADDATGE